MECVEGALKSSFRPEMVVKSTQQAVVVDDMWAVNGQPGLPGDDFFVDDLLDFSNGGIEDGFIGDVEEEEEEEEEQKNRACLVSVSPPKREKNGSDSDPKRTTFSVKDEFGSPPLPGGELSVPAEDLANLEWLSHFVEDSFSEYSLTFPAGKLPEKPNRSEPEVPVQTKPCFTAPLQTKARSKRSRTGGRVWSPLTETASSSPCTSSSSTSSSSSSALSNPWLIYSTTGPTQTAVSFVSKPAPKRQKKPAGETVTVSRPAQPPRRCSHCLVQKTPQWRAGPLGPKTLCNACGVRYKSGRLLPEYRPACSPTFSSEVHSNNHRKVLEMRRMKEVESGSALPVQSSR